METVITWAVIIGVIAAWRWIAPESWKGKALAPLPAPRPALPAGLPPGVHDAKRVRLEDAQTGEYVAVVAKVIAPADLTAPISGRPCVASDLVVVDSRSGERVARSLRAGTFMIDSGGSRATVDGRGAFVRLEHDHRADDLPRSRFPDVVPGSVPGTSFTADEGIIAPGQYVLVIGMAERPGSDGGAPGYRASADTRLHLAGGGARPSVVSTLPEDLFRFEA